jgi:hypothetical protein
VVGIADIEGAERVMGVSCTAAERNQMLGNLEGQITSALARRKVRLDNSVPMASRFDRRLPTFRAPAPQRALRFARAEAVSHDDEDIAFATIAQLSRWLASSVLTSRRLTEIYFACIEALGPGFLELPTRGMASLAAGKLTTGEPQASDRTFNVARAYRFAAGYSRRA